jgi:hypothetical protein
VPLALGWGSQSNLLRLISHLRSALKCVHVTNLGCLAGGHDHHARTALLAPSAGRGRLHRCCLGRVPARRRRRCHAWPCLATAELHRPVSWRVASAARAVPCAHFRLAMARPSFACRVATRVYPAAVASRVLTSGHSDDWTFPCLTCPHFSAPVSPNWVGRF